MGTVGCLGPVPARSANSFILLTRCRKLHCAVRIVSACFRNSLHVVAITSCCRGGAPPRCILVLDWAVSCLTLRVHGVHVGCIVACEACLSKKAYHLPRCRYTRTAFLLDHMPCLGSPSET